MKETCNEELYREVAMELGTSVKTVKDVIMNGMSKCTATMITNNEFNGVRWAYLGAFRAKHKALQVLTYMKGLNPVQREFFYTSIKRGDFKRMRENGHNNHNNS